MKRLTLLTAGLLMAGAAFAYTGDKGCCKGKKENCKKEAKAKCEKGNGCCKKDAAEKKA